MTRTPRQVALFISAVATGVGVLATLLLLLQPWASCPEIDDSPAGCPVSGAQLTLQTAAMLLTMLEGRSLLGG